MSRFVLVLKPRSMIRTALPCPSGMRGHPLAFFFSSSSNPNYNILEGLSCGRSKAAAFPGIHATTGQVGRRRIPPGPMLRRG